MVDVVLEKKRRKMKDIEIARGGGPRERYRYIYTKGRGRLYMGKFGETKHCRNRSFGKACVTVCRTRVGTTRYEGGGIVAIATFGVYLSRLQFWKALQISGSSKTGSFRWRIGDEALPTLCGFCTLSACKMPQSHRGRLHHVNYGVVPVSSPSMENNLNTAQPVEVRRSLEVSRVSDIRWLLPSSPISVCAP